MDLPELKVKVGDRVVISRPQSTSRFAANIERLSAVTAVRSKSFDAGGLCFRNDGREWGGHNRIRLVAQEEIGADAALAGGSAEASRAERAERAREDSVLAFLLSSRQEEEWLRLGIHELRRIAALHGIRPSRQEQPDALGIPGNH